MPCPGRFGLCTNRLNRIITRVNALPRTLQPLALSFVFGKAIPFAGTGKIRVEKPTESKSVLTMKNRRRVRNHIGSIHAAAMALLAESATEFIVGMNVPDTRILVIKSMDIRYVRRATGNLRAEANLNQDQRNAIADQEKGDVLVAIKVMDETGAEPVKCAMVWAWTTKKTP